MSWFSKEEARTTLLFTTAKTAMIALLSWKPKEEFLVTASETMVISSAKIPSGCIKKKKKRKRKLKPKKKKPSCR
jgi:hypothetical protein